MSNFILLSLKVDKDLQKKAQEWADRLLKNKRLEHRDDRSVGENVAYKFASNQSYFPGKLKLAFFSN